MIYIIWLIIIFLFIVSSLVLLIQTWEGKDE